MKNLKLVTETGRKRLGSIMKTSREQRGWSMDFVVDQIESDLGYKMGRSTISNLERGHHDPTWNTLEVLASLEYICWPGTSVALTAVEMILVACEVIAPEEISNPSLIEIIEGQFFSLGRRELRAS